MKNFNRNFAIAVLGIGALTAGNVYLGLGIPAWLMLILNSPTLALGTAASYAGLGFMLAGWLPFLIATVLVAGLSFVAHYTGRKHAAGHDLVTRNGSTYVCMRLCLGMLVAAAVYFSLSLFGGRTGATIGLFALLPLIYFGSKLGPYFNNPGRNHLAINGFLSLAFAVGLGLVPAFFMWGTEAAVTGIVLGLVGLVIGYVVTMKQFIALNQEWRDNGQLEPDADDEPAASVNNATQHIDLISSATTPLLTAQEGERRDANVEPDTTATGETYLVARKSDSGDALAGHIPYAPGESMGVNKELRDVTGAASGPS